MASEIIFTILQDILMFAIIIGLGYLLAKPLYNVFLGKNVWRKNKDISKVESFIYKLLKIDPNKKMKAKEYVLSIVCFSLVSIVFIIVFLMLQQYIFLNPNENSNISFSQAFNTAVSFVTNTNYQTYSGESTMSYFSQVFLLTTQNFISGAIGISVLFALVRGFINNEDRKLGNFWQDIVKLCVYFVLPLCIFLSILLVSQGVPQTFAQNIEYVGLDGTRHTLFLGPVASQVAIKQLFTNGGGFYGANSAYPFENPTVLSNILENISILVIPVALCFTLGKALKEKNQGTVILKAMSIIFVVCLILIQIFEYTNLSVISGVSQFGNIEGKETRFGISLSTFFTVSTTAASNGSINSMLSSYTPLGSVIPLFLMMSGEVVFGGVGSGLYVMITFAILTVFISGLMVGRTPEYLGKKIGSFDMKMVCLVILPPVLLILISTALTVILPSVNEMASNGSNTAMRFTEILYAFVSQGANNGSSMQGFNNNTTWTNIVGGFVMLISRYVPIIAIIYLADSLGSKKITPPSDGTLITTNGLFCGLLIGVIIIIGALSFLPALALGPIANAFGV